MAKRKSCNGWGKRHYVWKWYKGLFTKSGKDRRLGVNHASYLY